MQLAATGDGKATICPCELMEQGSIRNKGELAGSSELRSSMTPLCNRNPRRLKFASSETPTASPFVVNRDRSAGDVPGKRAQIGAYRTAWSTEKHAWRCWAPATSPLLHQVIQVERYRFRCPVRCPQDCRGQSLVPVSHNRACWGCRFTRICG